MRGSRVTLDVIVNEQGPFPFGLDTGASGDVWVTRALVTKLHLPVVEGFHVGDGSAVNSRSVEGVQIDSLRVGDVSFKQLRAPVLGAGPTQDSDPENYGTIGFELFKDYVLTYDYPSRQLRIATGQLPEPDGKTILSYSLERGSPQVEIQLGDLRVSASVDSGNIGGMLLPLALARKLRLRTPLRQIGKVASSLNEFDLYQSELDGNLQIGATTIRQPVLFFSDLAQQPNLGRNILRAFVLTFDQRNQRIQFVQP